MSHVDAYPPLEVHVVGGTVDVGDKRPKENRASHKTIVLTATVPTQIIAGFDPLRVCVYVNVMDNPVVLSSSTSAANDLANITGTLTNPNGRILPISNGAEYRLETQDELWISTNTFPTRVGFTIVREI